MLDNKLIEIIKDGMKTQESCHYPEIIHSQVSELTRERFLKDYVTPHLSSSNKDILRLMYLSDLSNLLDEYVYDAEKADEDSKKVLDKIDQEISFLGQKLIS